ncbi:hypothetical protein [Fusobacterium massiliense]|uniref:hypothetical protein n=1 Tax=Fusobacterium massiliense TaxID=1852365 RepID=UPI0028D3D1F6|nr:hypothetical protein [Fusobacterium massiliense]
MAEYTNHLRLVKPQGNEYYNIEQFNHNAELIDKETEKLSDAVTKIQEGATREKAGIVQYGTTEGKALEGMMLARMFGCVGYGGDIQDAGVKDVNHIYYDRNTRKMYKCLNQNSDVSANVANFIPLDNNSLLDRLENLITLNSKENIIRIGKVVIETIPISGYAGIRTGRVKTNFKKIYSINFIGLANKGQTQENLMRQLMYSSLEEIAASKTFELYVAGNQSVYITLIGEV